MRPLHDDGDASRGNLFADDIGDLVRKPLLDLQTAAEDVHDPGNLAQSNHLRARNVGDVALAEKWQQMMLTQAVEIDVLDDDHLAVVDCEEGIVDDLVDVSLVSAGEEFEGLFDALR